MKKIAVSTIYILLIVLLGCSDNSPKSTLYVTVLENGGTPVSGATVQIYASLQAWLSGGTPLLTGTTNSTGILESTQALVGSTLIMYAEKGAKNSWPDILGSLPLTQGQDGVYSGGAAISESLYTQVKSNSTKNYLLTDVKNSSGTSIFANVAACSKDNFIKLGLDQKMSINEGSNICNGQAPQTLMDYSTFSSLQSQTTHASQNVYVITLSGQPIVMYINTDFSIIFLVQSGIESVYTRQN